MGAARRPAMADAGIEAGLALLAALAFTVVAFGARFRLLGPPFGRAVEASGGRGVLLLVLVAAAFALLVLRVWRQRGAPPASPGPRPGAWLVRLRPADLVLAATFLALLLVLNVRGGRLEVDGPLLFAQLRSAVFDGDLDLTNEFAAFVPERYQYWAEEARRLGRPPNPTVEPGPAILWAPFFLLAHSLVVLARWGGAGVAADGYGAPYVNAVCLGSLVWAYVAAMLAARVARRFFPPRLSAVCTSAAWLATPLVWYGAFEPGMAHAPAAAAAAAFVWAWLRVRDAPTRRRRWLFLALTGGLLVTTQRYDAYFLLLPALTALDLLRRTPWAEVTRHRRALGATALGVLATLGLALAPLILANLGSRHANWLGESHLVGFTLQNWAHPHLGELLFSSRNGLLAWTPAAGLGVLGLGLLARRDRGLAAAALLTLGFGAYLLAASYSWSAAWSFGSRRFTEAFVLFSLGLTSLAAQLLARPALLGAPALAALVAWNLLLADQVRRSEIPRDETFAFSEAAARAARRLYGAIGHPPSAPAPWIFAWAYGVGPDRFDLLYGREPAPRAVVPMGTPDDEPFLGRGWSYPERGPDGSAFRWSEGIESTLLVSLLGGRPYRLTLRAEPSLHPQGLPQVLAVAVNGRPVERLTLARGPQTQALLVPASHWRSGLNEVRFGYAWTVEAGTVYGTPDARRVAWRVERAALRPPGEPD